MIDKWLALLIAISMWLSGFSIGGWVMMRRLQQRFDLTLKGRDL